MCFLGELHVFVNVIGMELEKTETGVRQHNSAYNLCISYILSIDFLKVAYVFQLAARLRPPDHRLHAALVRAQLERVRRLALPQDWQKR